MLRRLTAGILAGAVVFSIWWVQAPPRDETSYRESAETTIRKLSSRLETARLWVDELERGRVQKPAVKISLEEAETGASSALSRFEGYDPPRGLERLRSEVSTLGTRLESALGDLRIASEQGRWAELPTLAAGLPKLASRLDHLSDEVEP